MFETLRPEKFGTQGDMGMWVSRKQWSLIKKSNDLVIFVNNLNARNNEFP
jgi:hypothetical protein